MKNRIALALILGTAVAISNMVGPLNANAAVMHTDAIGTTPGPGGFINANATEATGQLGAGTSSNGSFDFRTLVSFNVADILSGLSLTIADLATTDLTFAFDVTPTDVAFVDAPDNDLSAVVGATYRADFLGFFADADLPGSGANFSPGFGGDWGNANDNYNIGEEIDSGIQDTAGDQSIAIDGFTLTGVTESTGDDFVVFGIRFDETGLGNGQSQNGFTNFTLDVVPEPASMALLAMGGLMIGARRRQG